VWERKNDQESRCWVAFEIKKAVLMLTEGSYIENGMSDLLNGSWRPL